MLIILLFEYPSSRGRVLSSSRSRHTSAPVLPCWDWFSPTDPGERECVGRSWAFRVQYDLYVYNPHNPQRNIFHSIQSYLLYIAPISSWSFSSFSVCLLGLLRVFAMRPGIVGIRGVKSELYLCMNQEGTAHGTVRNDIITWWQSIKCLIIIFNSYV